MFTFHPKAVILTIGDLGPGRHLAMSPVEDDKCALFCDLRELRKLSMVHISTFGKRVKQQDS